MSVYFIIIIHIVLFLLLFLLIIIIIIIFFSELQGSNLKFVVYTTLEHWLPPTFQNMPYIWLVQGVLPILPKNSTGINSS